MAITKEKGDLGEAMVLADVLRRGHKVAIPLGEDWRYDLIVLRNGNLERVQCKFDGGPAEVVEVKCQSTNGWKTYKYTEDDFDWLAVYHEAEDTCYYVPSSMLGSGRASIKLRVTRPKNNQVKNILWARDFLVF